MINGSEFPTSISLFEFGPDDQLIPSNGYPINYHLYICTVILLYPSIDWNIGIKKPSVPGNPRFYNWISLYSSFTFPQNVVVEKEILILTQTLPLIFDLEIDF